MLAQNLKHDAPSPPQALERDEVTRWGERSWDELYGYDPEELHALQLKALQHRFEDLMPKHAALRAQAERAGVTRVDRLEDAVPLLFEDAVYKSYPISLIEKNRFDLLTRWLAGYTTVDLSGIDVSRCEGIDEWLSVLDAQSPLRVVHTSGTTGKLSFFPRSTLEIEVGFEGGVKAFQGFGGDPGVTLARPESPRMPVVSPIVRHGFAVVQRFFQQFEQRVAPSPDQAYTLSNGTMSADLVSLSGRIRLAQAKGELSRMVLPERTRVAMRQYLEDLDRRPAETAAFFRTICETLQGKRVYVNAMSNVLYQAAREGLQQGVSAVFAPDSLGLVGGGGKGIVLPPDWLDTIREYTGIERWVKAYGMTELVGAMPMGDPGWYNVPAYHIPYLLDPETGALLPREGVVTGRLGFVNLLPQTNWGGVITGDKVTIDWDSPSPSGRKGPRIRDDIERYSAAVTGEDKITCAATVDNTDSALQALLAI